MKRNVFLIVSLLLAVVTRANPVTIETPNMSLVLNVDNASMPQYVYFGPKLNKADIVRLQYPIGGRMDAYPAYGLNTPAEAAIAMRHADGNMSTVLQTYAINHKDEGNATVTTISMKDPVYPITVDLNYRAYHDVDMIETWTTVTNQEKSTVTLTTFASGMLPIRRGDVWVSHLYGSWANEARLVEEPLNPGVMMIKNKDG